MLNRFFNKNEQIPLLSNIVIHQNDINQLLNNIPQDVMNHIANLLPYCSDLYHFRATCKRMHELIERTPAGIKAREAIDLNLSFKYFFYERPRLVKAIDMILSFLMMSPLNAGIIYTFTLFESLRIPIIVSFLLLIVNCLGVALISNQKFALNRQIHNSKQTLFDKQNPIRELLSEPFFNQPLEIISEQVLLEDSDNQFIYQMAKR